MSRRVLSLLCLVACAAGLTGCGGDTLSFDPVASAADKTVDTNSARVALTATMNVEGVGGMAFSGAGIYDGRTRSGAMNVRFSPGGLNSNVTSSSLFSAFQSIVLYGSSFSPDFRPGKMEVPT